MRVPFLPLLVVQLIIVPVLCWHNSVCGEEREVLDKTHKIGYTNHNLNILCHLLTQYWLILIAQPPELLRVRKALV